MTLARDERLALCALLADVGSDAPTLCEGWQTIDLAAHLVLRERRPDAAAGIMGGPIAGYTRRVQRELAAMTPYNDLIASIRTGPPLLSLFAIPGMDDRLNFSEYFVHHEDVRRAQPDWHPRDLQPAVVQRIWSQLRGAKLMLRKVPVGIEFARDDQPDLDSGHRITVKAKTPMVTVIGAPAELLLWSFGRTGAARVRLEGADADVRTVQHARWGV